MPVQQLATPTIQCTAITYTNEINNCDCWG